MSKTTIKDLEARLQILENNAQSNKDRINNKIFLKSNIK